MIFYLFLNYQRQDFSLDFPFGKFVNWFIGKLLYLYPAAYLHIAERIGPKRFLVQSFQYRKRLWIILWINMVNFSV